MKNIKHSDHFAVEQILLQNSKENVMETVNIHWEGHTYIWKHTIRLSHLEGCVKNRKIHYLYV